MINKVLCIDDDTVTLSVNELVIKKSQFAKEVITAKTVNEGLGYFSAFFSNNALINKEVPQLIFLDLQMPGMDGWGFLESYVRKYSERIPETKVVIVSSTINPEDYLKATLFNIVIDFINKPLTSDGLLELMENPKLITYF